MPEQQVVAIVAVALGLPLLGFLARWVFSGTINEIKQVAAEVKEMVKTINRHDTDIALSTMRIVKLEAEVVSLRERQHELASAQQAAIRVPR